MIIENIFQLFEKKEKAVQQTLQAVLQLEQRHISYEKPSLKKELDEIISEAAKMKLRDEESSDAS